MNFSQDANKIFDAVVNDYHKVDDVDAAINNPFAPMTIENILYLKKFPKIGDKVAKQIILDLKGNLNTSSVTSAAKDYDELIEVLKGLGYKQSDINKILPSIKSDLNIEEQVKEALKLMLK